MPESLSQTEAIAFLNQKHEINFTNNPSLVVPNEIILRSPQIELIQTIATGYTDPLLESQSKQSPAITSHELELVVATLDYYRRIVPTDMGSKLSIIGPIAMDISNTGEEEWLVSFNVDGLYGENPVARFANSITIKPSKDTVLSHQSIGGLTTEGQIFILNPSIPHNPQDYTKFYVFSTIQGLGIYYERGNQPF